MFMSVLVDFGSKFARWKGREDELARLIEAGPSENHAAPTAETQPEAEPETVTETAHATEPAAESAHAHAAEPVTEATPAPEPMAEAVPEPATEPAAEATPPEPAEAAEQRHVEESGVSNAIPIAETA
jgi:outer membrane biosynthesis protein TonB